MKQKNKQNKSNDSIEPAGTLSDQQPPEYEGHWANTIRDNPGLTVEKCEEMAEAFGFGIGDDSQTASEKAVLRGGLREAIHETRRSTVVETTKVHIIQTITDMLESKGLEIVRFAGQRYAELGRGYVTVCVKNSEENPWKEGLYYYTTEEENKLAEEELPYLTENDTKLAAYLTDYDPETDAVVMVWYGTDYYVNHLTDPNARTSIMALKK